jgi:hypothetical protein
LKPLVSVCQNQIDQVRNTSTASPIANPPAPKILLRLSDLHVASNIAKQADLLEFRCSVLLYTETPRICQPPWLEFFGCESSELTRLVPSTRLFHVLFHLLFHLATGRQSDYLAL